MGVKITRSQRAALRYLQGCFIATFAGVCAVVYKFYPDTVSYSRASRKAAKPRDVALFTEEYLRVLTVASQLYRGLSPAGLRRNWEVQRRHERG